MVYFIVFLAGMVAGVFMIGIWSLCVASKQSDEAMDNMINNRYLDNQVKLPSDGTAQGGAGDD